MKNRTSAQTKNRQTQTAEQNEPGIRSDNSVVDFWFNYDPRKTDATATTSLARNKRRRASEKVGTTEPGASCRSHNKKTARRTLLTAAVVKSSATGRLEKGATLTNKYTVQRKQRQQLRRHLIHKFALSQTSDNGTATHQQRFSPDSEVSLLRYHYYIHSDMNSARVTPLLPAWKQRIGQRIRRTLSQHSDVLQSQWTQVDNDYVFAVKKSMVDFLLHDSWPTPAVTAGGLRAKNERRSESLAGRHTTQQPWLQAGQHCRRLRSVQLRHTLPCVIKLRRQWHRTCGRLSLFDDSDSQGERHGEQVLDERNDNAETHKSGTETLVPGRSDILVESHSQNKNSNHTPTKLEALKNILEQRSTKTTDFIKNIFLDDLPAQIERYIAKSEMPAPSTHPKKFSRYVDVIYVTILLLIRATVVNSIDKFEEYVGRQKKSVFILQLSTSSNHCITVSPTKQELYETIAAIVGMYINCGQHLRRCLVDALAKISQRNRFIDVSLQNETTESVCRRIFTLMEQQYQTVLKNVSHYDKHLWLIKQETSEDLHSFLSRDHSFKEHHTKAEHYNKEQALVDEEMPKFINIGVFQLKCAHLVKQIVEKGKQMRDTVYMKIRENLMKEMTMICSDYEEIMEKVTADPHSAIHLADINNYTCQVVVRETLPRIEKRLQHTFMHILTMFDCVDFSEKALNINTIAYQWYKKTPRLLQAQRDTYERKNVEFKADLRRRREDFQRELKECAERVHLLRDLGDINEIQIYCTKVEDIKHILTCAQKTAIEINEEEVAFEWPKSEYFELDDINRNLEPYARLYDIGIQYAARWKEWMNSAIGAFQPDEIKIETDQIYERCVDLKKLITKGKSHELLQTLISQIDSFKEHMIEVETLGNPGLRDRHWEKISEIVGFPIKSDGNTTLERIIDMNLTDYMAKFETISYAATKEHELEIILTTMMEEWNDVLFCVEQYKQSDTYVLTSIDDIQLRLDDNTVKTQIIRGSPFMKPFEDTINKWEMTLSRLQDMLDEWMDVQIGWKSLEPLLTSPTIKTQIPEEARRFATIDKRWRDMMESVIEDTKVLSVLQIDKLPEKLKKSHDLLNKTYRGLENYLEKKRLFFPRFFYLSNQELLEILAETSNPESLQSHFHKCFSGVHRLTFSADADITHFHSYMDEKVPLKRELPTSISRSQVEKWFDQLNNAIRSTIEHQLQQFISTFDGNISEKALQNTPSQAILVADQTHTIATLDKIIANGQKIGKQYVAELNDQQTRLQNQIKVYVDAVAQETCARHRITWIALVMQATHNRDTTARLLHEVGDENSFSWLTTIKHRWCSGRVEVHVLSGPLTYGYEYMGDAVTTVITPATDRCLRLFADIVAGGASAIQLSATTTSGKRETVKLFARSLARHLVVTDCRATSSHRRMVGVCRGAAAYGDWLCFTGAHRAQTALLAAIGQHVQTIMNGVRQNSRHVTIDCVEIPLNKNCIIFMCDNNGAYPQSILPDNMQMLFRQVTLLQPDIGPLLKMALMVAGYTNAHSLAEYVHKIYRTCQRMFSQTHIGMNTLNAVLCRATELKNGSKHHSNENEMIRQSIVEVFKPRIGDENSNVFEKYVSKIVGNKMHEARFNEFDAHLKDVCEAMSIESTPYLCEKVESLRNLIEVHHGVIIVGETATSKTTILSLLKMLLDRPDQDPKSTSTKVETYQVYPGVMETSRLYGHFDASGEWIHGVIDNCIRSMETSRTTTQWLILDGALETNWTQQIETMIDGSERLALESGANMLVPQTMKVLVETTSLSHSNPRILSKCGLLYTKRTFSWLDTYVSWINKLPPEVDISHRKILKALCDCVLQPLMEAVFKNKTLQLAIKINEIAIASSLVAILDCFMHCFSDPNYKRSNTPQQVQTHLECSFLFSCVWAVGVLCDRQNRLDFSNILQDLSNGANHCDSSLHYMVLQPIPSKGLVFDYRYTPQQLKHWELWCDALKFSRPIPRDIHSSRIVIPTVETMAHGEVLKMLIENRRPLCLVGPYGSGKTTIIETALSNLDRKQMQTMSVAFSYCTCSEKLQTTVASQLVSRKKGVVAPPSGKKLLLIIEDLNTPAALGDTQIQRPVELLRQLTEQKAWYSVNHNTHVTVEDIQMVTCAAVNGREHGINDRLAKSFSMLFVEEYDSQTLHTIFSKMMLWHLDTRGFGKDFDPSIEQIVTASLQIYEFVRQKVQLTQAKVHYLFNMRDIWRLMQGILMSVPETFEKYADMKKLWIHEAIRVFCDRVEYEDDIKRIVSGIRAACLDNFGESLDELFSEYDYNKDGNISFKELETILFCNFMDVKSESSSNYAEVEDKDHLRSITEGCIKEHNRASQRPINLTLFPQAAADLCRLARVFCQPRGHLWLVGEHGHGRSTLTRLAGHVTECHTCQVKHSLHYDWYSWRNDLRNAVIKAGTTATDSGGGGVVLLLPDTHVQLPEMWDDICSVITLGSVAELFDKRQLSQICDQMRGIDKEREKKHQTDGSVDSLLQMFNDRVLQRLHVALVMSPSDPLFHSTVQRYRAALGRCVHVHVHDWTDESLQQLALGQLADISSISDEERVGCSRQLCTMHRTLAQDRRWSSCCDHNSALSTALPTHYIHLLETFVELYTRAQRRHSRMTVLYSTAIDRVQKAFDDVKHIDGQLKEFKDQLRIEANHIEEINAELESVNVQLQELEREVEAKNLIMKQANRDLINAKSENDAAFLEIAPKLQEATHCLTTITAADLTTVRTMKGPPQPVRLVFETLCMLENIKADKSVDVTSKTTDDFWPASKKLLSNESFIESLINFDPQTLPPKAMKVIRDKYICHPELDYGKLKSISVTVEKLFNWVSAMAQYETVMRMAEPSKQRLNQAVAAYDRSRGHLNDSQQQLTRTQQRLDQLTTDAEKAHEKRTVLEQDIKHSQMRLEAGDKLMASISDQPTRWQYQRQQLRPVTLDEIGTLLTMAGCLVYLGSHGKLSRQWMMNKWRENFREISQNNLHDDIDRVTSYGALLYDNDTVRQWQLQGLTTDDLTLHGAAVVTHSRNHATAPHRRPLLLDPQQRTHDWLASIEDGHLQTVAYNDPTVVARLENCVQFGSPLLISNVCTDIHPLFESVLQQQTFTQAGEQRILIGDTILEYNTNFFLYLTCKQEEPQFTMRLQAAVTIVDFRTNEESLEDQLMRTVLGRERASSEDEYKQILQQSVNNKKQIDVMHNNMLNILNDEGENLLESEECVNAVISSKIIKEEYEEKEAALEGSIKRTTLDRNKYSPIAKQAAMLYMHLVRLRKVHPMYRFTFQWFCDQFDKSIEKADKSGEIEQRIANIGESLAETIYTSVCGSVCEKDRPLVGVTIALSILKYHNKISTEEIDILCDFHPTFLNVEPLQSPSTALDNETWTTLKTLSDMSSFTGLYGNVCNNPEYWGQVKKSSNCNDYISDSQMHSMTYIQMACIICCIRPDMRRDVMQALSKQTLTQIVVEPINKTISNALSDTDCSIPIILLIDKGFDAVNFIRSYAQSNGLGDSKLISQSLGEEQEKAAVRVIADSVSRGNWVLLQNCHLLSEWMESLEKICDEFTPETTHPDFRLWITTGSFHTLPTSIIDRAVKISMDIPRSLDKSVERLWCINELHRPSSYQDASQPLLLQRQVHSFVVLHSLLIERARYGSLAWKGQSVFHDADVTTVVNRLKLLTSEGRNPALESICDQIFKGIYSEKLYNHGDKTVVKALLQRLSDQSMQPINQNEDITMDSSQVRPEQTYGNLLGLTEHTVTHAGVLESKYFSSLLSIIESESVLQHQLTAGDYLTETLEYLEFKLPANIEYTCRAEEIDTVAYMVHHAVNQEVQHQNKLICKIKMQINIIKKICSGELYLTEAIQSEYHALMEKKVPKEWQVDFIEKYSVIERFIQCLSLRSEYLRSVVGGDIMKDFRPSRLCFPDSFITAFTLDIHAQLAPDDKANFTIVSLDSENHQPVSPPAIQLAGLFIRGARWNYQHRALEENTNQTSSSTQLPALWIRRCENNTLRLNPNDCLVPCYTDRDCSRHLMNIVLPLIENPNCWLAHTISLNCCTD